MSDASTDTALLEAMSRADLSHLSQHVSSHTLQGLGAMERLALLAQLRDSGIERHGDRQKAATAISKAYRSMNAHCDVDSQQSATPKSPLEPQSFSIYCHNTTLADGTQLNNDEPAPEFVIAELERTTGVQRPSNAAQCSLHELHLHFMMGTSSTE